MKTHKKFSIGKWKRWVIKNDKGEVVGYYSRNFNPKKIKKEKCS